MPQPKIQVVSHSFPAPVKAKAKPQLQIGPAKRPTALRGGFSGGKFWNLYTHGMTSSSISKFLDCREQFRLTYCEGWSSHNVSMAIEFGSCIHWILEQIYRIGLGELPTGKALQILVIDYQKHWESLVPAPTPKQLEQQEMVYALAEATLPSYFRRYDGDVTGNYTFKLDGVWAPVKWVKLEEVFCWPYKMPDGRIIPLRGRKDATFLNIKDDLFVYDTKTKGQIIEAVIATMLGTDFQIMLYIWVELQEAIKNGTRKPEGGQLNIYRRPQLRKKDTESLMDFAARVKEDCATVERYDHYFTRIQMTVTEAELKHWHDTRLLPTLIWIQQWFDGTTPHTIVDKELVQYGKPVELADMILTGNPTGLYKRKHVFPELPDVVF